MSLHGSTFQYLSPTLDQTANMKVLRDAAQAYAEALDALVPEGADKTYLLRKLREVGMWANIAITRNQDGSPRS